MKIAESFMDELDREAKATLRVLERVPKDKLDWRPHPKSRTIGELAWHIAKLPSLAVMGLREGKRETSGARPPDRAGSDFAGTYRESLNAIRNELSTTPDDRLLNETFSFLKDGQPVITLPKAAFLRTVILNHLVHHRGQLTVYLRLLDVAVPVVYGSTADENAFERK
jgi:uncharacterized damage-inducible protein DinB